MIQLLTTIGVIVAAGPALGYLAAATRYRKRLDDAEDRADLARDIAADAMEQLRATLTAEAAEALAERADRVVHGMTAAELIRLSAYDTELEGSFRLSRWRKRLDRRARKAALLDDADRADWPREDWRDHP